MSSRLNLVRRAAPCVALAVVIAVSGCGDQSRAVIVPTNPSAPASQISSYAVTVSAPSATSAGVVTVIDYAGDTIMATAPVGLAPTQFTIDGSGTVGYSVNGDGTLSNFPISTNLQLNSVTYSTLPANSLPSGLFAPNNGLWISDLNQSVTDVMTSMPVTFRLSVPVAPTPLMVVGPALSASRYYSISRNNSSTPAGSVAGYDDMSCNTNPAAVTINGEADAIETSGNTVSARIPVGACPVYAVLSSDAKRVFVINRGSDTVSVINTETNSLNSCTPFVDTYTGRTVTCHPTLPLSTSAVTKTGISPANGTTGMTAVAGPVFAEYNAVTGQLIVADYDGGTISVIDVSLDAFGNDSANFGLTYTIPVGKNPASVAVLSDGKRAYAANQSDGTVTVVKLSSHTVETTINVTGHPRTIVSTDNSLYGKVYVSAPDSPYLSVIKTDVDQMSASILVQGKIVDVRTSTKDGSQNSNKNTTSWLPGSGRPCNLPGSTAAASLATCRAMP